MGFILYLPSCTDLDQYPLAQPSIDTWYRDQTEFEMAVNDLYRIVFWPMTNEVWTDNRTSRDSPGSTIVSGSFNSESDEAYTIWTNAYKSIARANTIINSVDKGRANGISDNLLIQYEAEARFARASRYAELVFLYGDVVYVDRELSLAEGFGKSRTPKQEVITKIYDDYDFAIKHLPETYNDKNRATKGAALALKARWALFFEDYEIAIQHAQECMDLNLYELHDDFESLFLARNSQEAIFLLPRSFTFNVDVISDSRQWIPRNASGYVSKTPSWALFAAFECTDGLTIDKSPLFDPRDPFKNRDPRCAATIVEFGTRWLDFDYDPHPDALEVMNYTTGTMVRNQDTRANAEFASFNGLVLKKGIDKSWGTSTGYKPDNDYVIMRYADLLLVYAEAKIELNQIDQSVLDAINKVRARAYKVDYTNISNYPAVTTTDQSELRRVLRRERRVEFSFEGLRYYDLIRWRIAGLALNKPSCGLLYPAKDLREKVVNAGHWFWAYPPELDENDIADFSRLIDEGLVMILSQGNWNDRTYLWPIPAREIVINNNLIQNDGY